MHRLHLSSHTIINKLFTLNEENPSCTGRMVVTSIFALFIYSFLIELIRLIRRFNLHGNCTCPVNARCDW